MATFRFVRSEKYVRKGLLRLCVAAGITWIGWLGYKSLHALTHDTGWLPNIVWLILLERVLINAQMRGFCGGSGNLVLDQSTTEFDPGLT
jgi:hypothetical protein